MTTIENPITDPASNPETPAPDAPATDTWKAPANQAELDKIITTRLERERAKFADYEALAEKASYWDQLEAESLTEYEKQSEALTAAEQRVQAATERIVSAELRAAGVPAELIEDLNLARFIDGDGDVDEAAIEALSAKYQALSPTSPRMAPNPAQGTSAQPPLSLAERIVQAQQAGDTKTVMRLKAAMAVGNTN